MNRLASRAFREVLGKRQTKYRRVLEWLDGKIVLMERREQEVCRKLRGVVE
jgi:hypothetical protein